MSTKEIQQVLALLAEIRDLLKLALEPNAHSCYRCGRMTMSDAAWCPICLRDAEERQRRYPALRPPSPRMPSKQRAAPASSTKKASR